MQRPLRQSLAYHRLRGNRFGDVTNGNYSRWSSPILEHRFPHSAPRGAELPPDPPDPPVDPLDPVGPVDPLEADDVVVPADPPLVLCEPVDADDEVAPVSCLMSESVDELGDALCPEAVAAAEGLEWSETLDTAPDPPVALAVE
jgi:hypothetical protein